MKKLIFLLVFSTLFSVGASAQFANYVQRGDTTPAPVSGFKMIVAKSDSQIVAYDRKSWKNVPLTLTATKTIDFAQGTSTTVVDSTVSVPGARLGDEVIIGVPHASVTTTATYWGWVSAANVVTIRYSPKATENPASGLFHVTVVKYRRWY
jgi:hypothetical protein